MAILGVDVSKWQGVMNWERAKQAGARFGVVRAGSVDNSTGACYKDYQFDNNKEGAEERMPTGYYWYFRPNHDPLRQADYYSSLLFSTSRSAWVDVETQAGLTPEVFRDRLARFIGRIYANLGVWAGIYTRATIWNPYSYGSPPRRGGVAESALWSRLPLWVARYGVLKPWTYGSKYKLRDWTTWNLHQFSADGNGRGAEFGAQSSSIDLDWFNGNEAELAELFNGLPVVLPVVPTVTVTATKGLNIRAAAGEGSSRLGWAIYGSTWERIDSQPGEGGEIWHKVGGWVSGAYTKSG